MRKLCLMAGLIIGSLSFSATPSYAGTPIWTFTPLTPTKIDVNSGSSATIQYQVTNQSRKTHTLAMKPIKGITQITTGGLCANPFTLTYQQSCVISLQVSGSALTGNIAGGPQICENSNPLQCYQPSPADVLNITLASAPTEALLSSSVLTLALSVSGLPRVITITNISSIPANNVTYSFSPALPAGTTIIPADCGTIYPGASCALTVTPGASPSSPPGDTNPVPINLMIAGTNTNTLATTLNVLGYGSVYQDGYLFAIDDSTPSTTSISGKVFSLVDQSNGILWSSTVGGTAAADNIPGIYDSSTNPPDACNGNADGACNTNVITSFYPSVNTTFYASGICRATIGGYSDWYLPSICEMGYDTSGAGSGCGSQVSPTMQNIQTNLLDGGIISINGDYWSSTEFTVSPTALSWVQGFSVGTGMQAPGAKSDNSVRARCVRVLTS